MRVSKQAFDLINVSYEEYIIYCDNYNKKFYTKKTLQEFFNDVRNGNVVRDIGKGRLIRIKKVGEEK